MRKFRAFYLRRSLAGLVLAVVASAPAAAQDNQSKEAERIAQLNQIAAVEAQRHLDMYKAGQFEELTPTAIGWTITTAGLCGIQTNALMNAIRERMARQRREDINNFYVALNYGMGLRINPNFPMSANICSGLERVVSELEAQIRLRR